jgi:hypothetical protein
MTGIYCLQKCRAAPEQPVIRVRAYHHNPFRHF